MGLKGRLPSSRMVSTSRQNNVYLEEILLQFSTSLFADNTSGLASPQEHPNFGVFRRRRPIRIARTRSSVGDGGPSGALKNLAWVANAAIQRAPSRLYRLHDETTASSPSMLKSQFHPRKSQSFRDLRKVVVERDDEPASRPANNNCCGPEFIVKSSLAPHTVTIPHQPKKVIAFVTKPDFPYQFDWLCSMFLRDEATRICLTWTSFLSRFCL